MRTIPHVAVLIESSRAYGRGLLEGVARYVHQRERWSLYYQPRGLDDPVPKWLNGWKGDGILARINDRRMADAVMNTGLPVVDLRGQLPELGIPYVGPNRREVVRLSYGHFLERGFRQFACSLLAREAHPGILQSCKFLREMAVAGGHACEVYNPHQEGRKELSWEEEQERFVRWLRELPKPVGLVTFTDDCGYQVLDACRRAGIRVPDEVAVLGCGNDATLCNLTDPPMSSVDLGAARIGYEATAMLARIMHAPRHRKKPANLLLSPSVVVTRQSSDVLAVSDRAVADAVHFIRQRACDRVTVDEVLKHVSLSRSVLDLRFKEALGRTPKAEILRVQLEHARRLLVESNLPLDVVAQRSGFSSAKYLGDAFTRVIGVRPGEYRQRFQAN